MKTLFLSVLFLATTTLASAQNELFQFYTDSVKLKNDNDSVIKDFEARVKAVDPSVDLKGVRTVIENGSATGYYLAKTNLIYLPSWETMPPLFKEFGTKVAGSKQRGEELARLFYYGFFLPHEVAHALQFNADKRNGNEYDNEYEANVLATLYWRMKGREKELKRCYEIARNVLTKLKNPIPAGEDPKAYFTAHYDTFVQDPEKYGYIMFYQVVKAYEDKTLPAFDQYVKKMLNRKS
ncbi:MAG: hypothetical protein EOO01_40540 [Chitinophagaceae bacterium]|nr:MAG: hypothetical protein EOO01_40540 [Chitinophagaceae bacterium]